MVNNIVSCFVRERRIEKGEIICIIIDLYLSIVYYNKTGGEDKIIYE